jgi:hypothetical protein
VRLLFLAPLFTGLVSAYIAQRSQDEMAYLTGAVAVVSLLISLLLAPWQVQLLLLMGTILTVGYIWRQSSKEYLGEEQQTNTTVASKQDKPISPSTTVAIPTAVTQKSKVRKYRGVLMEETPSQPNINPSIQPNLKYRGADVPQSSKSDVKPE